MVPLPNGIAQKFLLLRGLNRVHAAWQAGGSPNCATPPTMGIGNSKNHKIYPIKFQEIYYVSEVHEIC